MYICVREGCRDGEGETQNARWRKTQTGCCSVAVMLSDHRFYCRQASALGRPPTGHLPSASTPAICHGTVAICALLHLSLCVCETHSINAERLSKRRSCRATSNYFCPFSTCLVNPAFIARWPRPGRRVAWSTGLVVGCHRYVSKVRSSCSHFFFSLFRRITCLYLFSTVQPIAITFS